MLPFHGIAIVDNDVALAQTTPSLLASSLFDGHDASMQNVSS